MQCGIQLIILNVLMYTHVFFQILSHDCYNGVINTNIIVVSIFQILLIIALMIKHKSISKYLQYIIWIVNLIYISDEIKKLILIQLYKDQFKYCNNSDIVVNTFYYYLNSINLFLVIVNFFFMFKKINKIERIDYEMYMQGIELQDVHEAETLEFLCSICLENEKKTIVKLKCSHLFHKSCIFHWYNINKEKATKCFCPVCRSPFM